MFAYCPLLCCLSSAINLSGVLNSFGLIESQGVGRRVGRAGP